MAKMSPFLLALSVAIAVVSPGQAQSSNPLLTGTLTTVGSTYSCTLARNASKFLPNMTCQDATVTGCNNVDQISLTFGYIGPTTPQGTVVFFTGGTGTTPQENEDDTIIYATNYQNYFEVVYIEWNSPWEKPKQMSDSGGGNILQAACRPATFLKYINDTSSIHKGAMCAQGSSAGSAAIAYSMSWYNAGSYLKNVELLSGPVLSKIDQGCSTTNSNITVCGAGTTYCSAKTTAWTDHEIYTPNDVTSINNWSALTGCGSSSGQGNLTAWANMSIVDGSISGGTSTFSFPGVQKHGWLCASSTSCTPPDCPNNSAAEGSFFYDAVSAMGDIKLTVTGITGCSGAEGVAQGKDPDSGKGGATAIENDMKSSCILP